MTSRTIHFLLVALLFILMVLAMITALTSTVPDTRVGAVVAGVTLDTLREEDRQHLGGKVHVGRRGWWGRQRRSLGAGVQDKNALRQVFGVEAIA